MSSNVTSVDVTRAEARGNFDLTVVCESNASISQIIPLLQVGKLTQQGSTLLAVGAGRPTGKELGSVETLKDRGEQFLAPDFV